MPGKVIVIYYSRTGNTQAMAELIAEGVRKRDVEVTVKSVNDIDLGELLEYDGIVVGSPVYYGSMAAELKKMFDDSVRFHGKLDGLVGGAFATSANIGGGNETTIMSIVEALLIHGMIVPGVVKGDHYGPVSIDAPDQRVKDQCIAYGEKISNLVLRLKR